MQVVFLPLLVLPVVCIVSVVVEPVGRSRYSGAESWACHRKVFETQNEGSSRLGGSVGGCAVDGSSVLRPVLHNSDRHLHQLPQPSAGGCPHHFMCSPGMFQCCGAQAKTLEAFCGPKFANCRLLVSIVSSHITMLVFVSQVYIPGMNGKHGPSCVQVLYVLHHALSCACLAQEPCVLGL